VASGVVDIKDGKTTILIANFGPDTVFLAEKSAIAEVLPVRGVKYKQRDGLRVMQVDFGPEVGNHLLGERARDTSGEPALATLHEVGGSEDHLSESTGGGSNAGDDNAVRQAGSQNESLETEEKGDVDKILEDIMTLDLGAGHLPTGCVDELRSLLREFSDIFCTDPTKLKPASVLPHDIDVQGNKPVNNPLRRASPAQREIVRDKIEKLLSAGLISESRSPWASAVVLVKKKDGSSRFCVDYRNLNSLTKKDKYPLPRIDDTLDVLGKSNFFTALDLKSGYHQIPVCESDREKTAFITHQGLFQWNVMPFGLCNAPATFQRCMDLLLAGVKWSSCMVYLDDIICFSRSFRQHLMDLREIFVRVRNAGLKFNLPKCTFAGRELLYLGHMVTRAGIKPDPALISKMQGFPRPTSKSEVRSFLGLTGYYRRFIKDFSHLTAPLSDLTKEAVCFLWTEEHEGIFVKLIKALSTQPVLAYPDFSRPFRLQTDASDIALGAVLAQDDSEGVEHPVAFISRKLREPELKYDTREKEALCIVWACEVFRPYLIGRHFDVQTDHRNLKWLMNYQKPGRLSHWALKLQDFDFTIKYRPGKANANADALSRVEIDDHCCVEIDDHMCNVECCDQVCRMECCSVKLVSLPDDVELVEMQERDPLLGRLVKFLRGVGERTPEVAELLSGVGCYSISDSNGLLLYSRKGEEPRVVVPVALRQEIFRVFHDIPISAHLGRNKTLNKIKERFYWRGMDEDVATFVRGCLVCRLKKGAVPRHQGKLKLFSATRPFEMVCFDLLGPFPRTVDGNVYVGVFVDRFTRWVELTGMPDARAHTAARAFVDVVVCRHGCPRALLTDRGSNFTSQLFREVCRLLRVNKIFTTAYHPETDGPPERLNRFIVSALYSLVADDQTDWDEFLPAIAFAYRSCVIEGLGFSPFEMTYGRKPALPTDVLYGSPPKVRIHQAKYKLDLFENMRRVHQEAVRNQSISDARKKEYFDASHSDVRFEVGDLALLYTPAAQTPGLSRKLLPKFSGPHVVIECHSELVYSVREIKTRKVRKVSIKRLLLFCPADSELQPQDEESDSDHGTQGESDSGAKDQIFTDDKKVCQSGTDDCVDLSSIIRKAFVDEQWRFLVKKGAKQTWVPAEDVSRKVRKEWESLQRSRRAGHRRGPQ
jgi:transposase InsO family protein